jgi:hypothetical protein
MKKSDKKLTAVTLSWILIGLIILSVVGAFAGAWYLGTLLKEDVVSVRTLEHEAATNTANLNNARILREFIANNKDDINKASAIVADTKTYQYQNQVVQDVTHFANIAGVTILGFDFPITRTVAKPSASGVKSIAANITLQNPVSYTSYIKFLKLIEQNLTRMQITNISITPDPETIGLISNPQVGLEVYVR